MSEIKYQKIPVYAVCFTVVFKLLFLYTHYIQEDAFITWRVAQNLLDYGVIGFNGNTKISASTTHLYVFVSYIFNVIFGKENFIVPLLIFNSIVFTIGSLFLSHLLLKNSWQKAIFIFLIGILPPAIKISILGMEYGILFFLEMALLYYGFYKNKKWVQIVLPVFILFTRIDTVIYLGIIFFIDVLRNRKIKWLYTLGCIFGIAAVLGFNRLYFGEWINNTIVAKKIAYDHYFTFAQNIEYFAENFGNFWGMLKLPGTFNPVTLIMLFFELVCFIYLIRQKNERNHFLWIIFIFGWAKQLVFISQRSLFDWYYWVPQIVLFVPVLIFILEQKVKKKLWFSLFIIVYIFAMMAFQTVHAIATGNGEWNYRRNIGLFLNTYEKDKSQWIFLEPAGYIPYFSGLKTIDEVGLVDKQIQHEIQKDKVNFRINTIKKRTPKYILSYKNLYKTENADYFARHYKLIKEFRVRDHLKSSHKLIQKIYFLKPSGSDYNLYERID